MSNSANRCRVLATALVTAAAAAALSGCAKQGGFEASSFLVTPGKYTLYSCPQMAPQTAARIARKGELDALIAKAGPGAGAVAATLAYRTEYAQVQGEIAELAKESAAKNCPPPPPPPPKPAAAPSPPKPKKGKPAPG